MTVLGIDIGGSGIKGAPVDVSSGGLAGERYRVATPQPADVPAVVAAVAEVAGHVAAAGGGDGASPPGAVGGGLTAVGVTFPGVVAGGVTRTAANLHPSWIDAPAAELFSAAVGHPVTVLNDADAAGVAEVRLGAGRDVPGVVLMVTFGTGIGTAVFTDGRLVPNTELGHVELRGADAERYASDRVREAEKLDWPAFAARAQEYLAHLEALLWPRLIIVGGGVSKRADHWLPRVRLRTPVVPAALRNHAGIIGAALAAAEVGPLSGRSGLDAADQAR